MLAGWAPIDGRGAHDLDLAAPKVRLDRLPDAIHGATVEMSHFDDLEHDVAVGLLDHLKLADLMLQTGDHRADHHSGDRSARRVIQRIDVPSRHATDAAKTAPTCTRPSFAPLGEVPVLVA